MGVPFGSWLVSVADDQQRRDTRDAGGLASASGCCGIHHVVIKPKKLREFVAKNERGEVTVVEWLAENITFYMTKESVRATKLADGGYQIRGEVFKETD